MAGLQASGAGTVPSDAWRGGGSVAGPAFLGARLEDARQEASLSRTALGQRVGVSPERIRLWVLGLEQPLPRFVPQLAEAVRLSPWDLIDADSAEPRVADLRVVAGKTLKEVALAASLSYTTYYRLEQGIGMQRIDEEVMQALADALSVGPSDVAGALRRVRAGRNARSAQRVGAGSREEEAHHHGRAVGNVGASIPAPREGDERLSEGDQE